MSMAGKGGFEGFMTNERPNSPTCRDFQANFIRVIPARMTKRAKVLFWDNPLAVNDSPAAARAAKSTA